MKPEAPPSSQEISQDLGELVEADPGREHRPRHGEHVGEPAARLRAAGVLQLEQVGLQRVERRGRLDDRVGPTLGRQLPPPRAAGRSGSPPPTGRPSARQSSISSADDVERLGGQVELVRGLPVGAQLHEELRGGATLGAHPRGVLAGSRRGARLAVVVAAAGRLGGDEDAGHLASESETSCSAGTPYVGSRRNALAAGARAVITSALTPRSSSSLGSSCPTAANIRFRVLRWSIATTAKVPSVGGDVGQRRGRVRDGSSSWRFLRGGVGGEAGGRRTVGELGDQVVQVLRGVVGAAKAATRAAP